MSADHKTLILHLLRQRPRTTGELFRDYGIGRAGARVLELRQQGYDIHTEMIEVPTRHGKTARVACYSLRGEIGRRPSAQPAATATAAALQGGSVL